MVAVAEISVQASIVRVQRIIPVLDVNTSLMHAKQDNAKTVHHASTKDTVTLAFARLDSLAKIAKTILSIVKKHRAHRVPHASIYHPDSIVNVHSIWLVMIAAKVSAKSL